MKYSMITVSVLGLLYGVGAGAAEESTDANTESPQSIESIEIKTDEEKVNYSLGFELGKDLKGQELKLLPDALLRGAEDGVSGSKPLVRPTQRAAALKQIKEMRAQANLEQAQAFLAANAEKEGVKTLPSGLQYRELQAGEGKTPAAGDSVVVNYRGNLIDGTEFDSSYERGKPAAFQVKKVIKGWREALQLMKEGAKWELYIPPDLAYGKRGRPNTIAPNSALVFEVELISVK
jgi:FKBP-type peptidyl-prolyl cis-trans isomerase FklB